MALVCDSVIHSLAGYSCVLWHICHIVMIPVGVNQSRNTYSSVGIAASFLAEKSYQVLSSDLVGSEVVIFVVFRYGCNILHRRVQLRGYLCY